MQQEQRAVQYPERRRPRLRLSFHLSPLQQRLGELQVPVAVGVPDELVERLRGLVEAVVLDGAAHLGLDLGELADDPAVHPLAVAGRIEAGLVAAFVHLRSEEHTSELQSLMRISYAVF